MKPTNNSRDKPRSERRVGLEENSKPAKQREDVQRKTGRHGGSGRHEEPKFNSKTRDGKSSRDVEEEAASGAARERRRRRGEDEAKVPVTDRYQYERREKLWNTVKA